ncbi:phage terminase large subunit family protein, partial [Salmonella enterica]|nr:phage terminase large subunit family protein [Salmonella enterica]
MGETVWSTAFFRALRPKSRLTVSEWADKYRHVAPGTSPEPGPWRTSRVPYLREPMDVIGDADTETVVMQCSSQIGKSEMQLNVMGYFTDQEPSPQLMIYPTVEAAEAFSKERIDPTFKYSPGLKNKLREGKEGRGAAKKSSTTIRMKHYAGGYVALVGANSPAGLASRPVRILLADEIDRYGVTQEGDPLKLGIQRTTNFHNRKKVFVSTPVLE